jgi:hypothetical protein
MLKGGHSLAGRSVGQVGVVAETLLMICTICFATVTGAFKVASTLTSMRCSAAAVWGRNWLAWALFISVHRDHRWVRIGMVTDSATVIVVCRIESHHVLHPSWLIMVAAGDVRLSTVMWGIRGHMGGGPFADEVSRCEAIGRTTVFFIKYTQSHF